MAKKNAQIEMMVKIDQAVKQLNMLGQQIDKLGARSAKAMNQGAAGMQKQNAAIAKMGAGLMRATMAMTGFGSAAGAGLTVFFALRQEVMAITNALDKARNKTKDFGQVMRTIAFETEQPGAPGAKLADMNLAQLEKQFQMTPDKTKAANLFRFIHGAESTLAYSQKSAIATEMSSNRWAMDPEALNLAGAAVATSIGKSGKAPDVTTEAGKAEMRKMIAAQMGTFESAKSAGRPTKAIDFYQNIAPLANQLKQLGFAEQEAMLIGTSATQAITDVTGTMTRTAVINFAAQLEQKKFQHLGVSEETKKLQGMELMHAIQTKARTDPKYQALQTDLLGAFADLYQTGNVEDYDSLTAKQAKGTLRGKGAAKYQMMNLIRQPKDPNDKTNILNIMRGIVDTQQIAAKFEGPAMIANVEESNKMARARYQRSIARAESTFSSKMAADEKTTERLEQAAEATRQQQQKGLTARRREINMRKSLGITGPLTSGLSYMVGAKDYSTPEAREDVYQGVLKEALKQFGAVDRTTRLPYEAPTIKKTGGRWGGGGMEAPGETRSFEELTAKFGIMEGGKVREFNWQQLNALKEILRAIEREGASTKQVEIVGGEGGAPGGQNNNPAGGN